jgi:O-methyltransferase
MKALKEMRTIMRMVKALCDVDPDNYKRTYMNKSDIERVIFKFITNDSGTEYGINLEEKLKLTKRIMKGHAAIRPLSFIEQHFWLVEEILRVPKSIAGDVVECGCFNGGSTISLSLACAMTHRKLFVCDSFEGLPEPQNDEKFDINAHSAFSKTIYRWERGEFHSAGGLEGVKANVQKFGDIGACEFVKGYFADSLSTLDTESIVLIFEDADLKSSVESCVLHLWPKLQKNCKFVCHEPWSINVVSVFYDRKWWQNNLHTHPPGFYGSGYGVKSYAGLGFAQKFDRNEIMKLHTKRRHWGSNGFKG